MKKIVCLLLCIGLICAAAVCSFAATSVSSRPSAYYISRGSQVTFYLNLNTSEKVQGFGVSVVYDNSSFDYVSSGWNVSNATLADYNPDSKNGTVLLSEKTLCGGDVFYITLQAKSTAVLADSTVSFALKVGADGETYYTYTSTNISCDHSYGAWKTVTQPTCTESGVQERKCSICGDVQKSYSSALGHKYEDWITTAEADCTHGGEQTRKCSVCGSSQTRSTDPLGHKLGDDRSVSKEATCTEQGEASGTCTVCGQSVTVKTPYAEHQYGDWYDTKEATCTENGIREHECSVCGHRESQESLPLGHDFTNGDVIRQANIYTTGLVEAVCSRCKEPGSIVTPCSYTDEESGISFETDEKVFPAGSIVKISLIDQKKSEEKPSGIDRVISDVQKIIDKFNKKDNSSQSSIVPSADVSDMAAVAMTQYTDEYVLYRIRAVNADGDDVDINGNVEIQFPIPEGYSRNTAVFLMDENGNAWDEDVDISTENNTAVIKSGKLGCFVLANLDKAPDDETGLPEIYHFIIEGFLILILLITMLISGGRRKKIKKLKNLNSETAEETEETTAEEVSPQPEETKPPKPTLDDIFGKSE